MEPQPKRQDVNYIWPLIGFALGTVIVSPLVLSIEPRDRILGGIVAGGIPCALLGLWYAFWRAKRSRP